jgi:hypothetical protein
MVPGPTPDTKYLVGVWKRTPFNLGVFPQALNASKGRAHLDTFDAHSGNVWSFVFLDRGLRSFVLSCDEPKVYLGPQLTTVENMQDAAVWQFRPCVPFRNGPNDISIQIMAEGSNLILCSDETSRRVMLLTPAEADATGPKGEWVYNNAWECTPDEDLDLYEEAAVQLCML